MEHKYIISTFICIYILLSSTGAFYEKMDIFELILNNTFRYQIMVQGKIIAPVTNMCGNRNRTKQNKVHRITVKFKENLIIVFEITYNILCFCTETMMKKPTE